MTIGDSAPVKILKGGKLQKSKVERFSILNVKPEFKDSKTKHIVNFTTKINDDDNLMRSRTEKPNSLSKRDLTEIDEYSNIKYGKPLTKYSLDLKKKSTEKPLKINNIDFLDTKSDSPDKSPKIM